MQKESRFLFLNAIICSTCRGWYAARLAGTQIPEFEERSIFLGKNDTAISHDYNYDAAV